MSFIKPLIQPDPWPKTLAELDDAERLVVRAVRQWVMGLKSGGGDSPGGHWAEVWNLFAKRYGPEDGRRALGALSAIVRELDAGAIVTVHFHRPDCSCLGADEVYLLGLIAAFQSGRPGLARKLAERMVAPDGLGGFFDGASRLARVLARFEPGLKQRIREREIEAGLGWLAGPAATLH